MSQAFVDGQAYAVPLFSACVYEVELGNCFFVAAFDAGLLNAANSDAMLGERVCNYHAVVVLRAAIYVPGTEFYTLQGGLGVCHDAKKGGCVGVAGFLY